MTTLRISLTLLIIAALCLPAVAQRPRVGKPSFVAPPPGKFTLDNEGGKFLLDGKPFQIISGEMHYARIPPEYWRDRLMKARSMGLNTVTTYVFWNLHEPKRGEFNFSGIADVAQFVKIAQEVGLYVILRPGPYACAEWEFGGYPSWLLKDNDLKVRSTDERFLKACESYLIRLGKELAPLQNTHGGPIIMVQVENEYGSYGSDKVYMGNIRDMIKHAGFDVPLFTADGPTQMPNGYLSDVLPGVNGATGQDIFDTIKKYRPNGPFFVPEYYPGWLDHWGEAHADVNADTCVRDLDWMLSHGVSVNLYMFHGGTNFGFMNGANYGGRFQPQPTSYDYDAPLDEAGRPTPKYFKLRDLFARYQRSGTTLPDVSPVTPVITIPRFELNESTNLFNDLPKSINSKQPLSMEDIGQSYGYILYRTRINAPVSGKLIIKELRDYGILFLNGKKIASLDRRNKQSKLMIEVSQTPAVLDILVENGGRINYGRQILENRKGITGSVTLDGKELTDWEIFSLPMENIGSMKFVKESADSGPILYRGKFTLNKIGDAFLDMRGWKKGCVWVNNHNLGRFWYIGPQQTLYLPGPFLQKGVNEIIVLELEESKQHSVEGIREPILNQLMPDELAPPLPKRDTGKVQLNASDIVKKGSFVPGDKEQDFNFAPLKGRYICLQSLSSQKSDPFASIAEFYLMDDHKNILPRDKWKVQSVDCEELFAEDGRAENAFDDDSETIWHTLWGSSKPDHPHYLVIDLGDVYSLTGFRYLPRMGEAPGKIKEFRFYVWNNAFDIIK